jgi:hypothetical protein
VGVGPIDGGALDFAVGPDADLHEEDLVFSYGAPWSLVRRNLFNWKHDEIGNLEAKVKTFCAIPQVLRFLKDFILSL